MKRLFPIFATFLLLSVSVCFAQEADDDLQPGDLGQPQPVQNNAVRPQPAPDNAIRGSFGTILIRTLDSTKLQDGDQVICRTLGPIRSRSGLMIPTGSKVIGHVTQATARGKGDSDSTLAIVFDKIEISKGKEIAMKGTLQSVALSLGNTGPNTGDGIGSSNMGKNSAGGGGMTGGSSEADPVPNPIASRTVAVAPMPPPDQTVGIGANPIKPGSRHPLLNSQSEGVAGFRDLRLDENHVLISSGKEVKLDDGTQMMIHAEIEIPVQ